MILRCATTRGAALVAALLCSAGNLLWAGDDTRPAPPATPPVTSAVRVEAAPTLDGEVLSDPAWQIAPAASDFWQKDPDEGRPSSERTEVRIVYTDEVLYFGVVCYDEDPSTIIISDSRRDASLQDTDSFQMILDTYLDRQNGFVFGTNPAGIEYDGQVANEGQGSGFFGGGGGGGTQQRGSGGGFNLNWDGSWEVRTRITDIGWSAEFAIPFRTLRFPRQDVQSWGVNFQRNIRRRNEQSFWAPIPRQFNIYRLSLGGRLDDLAIPGQRNLKLIPYALGEVRRLRSVSGGTNWVGNVGVDLKYSITPSLTLDATYNTDFAQVEVDEQQINLDRFNLFFPEKRPFFLENAGLFQVGEPGELDFFFSRRIGIGPEGEIIPILAGARLTGNISGLSIGFLNMQTEEAHGLPAENFTVARVRRELRNRSYLGGLFVSRQGTGDLAPGDDHNRTYAVDGRLGIGEYGEFSGFAALTSTPGLESDDYAFKVDAAYNAPTVQASTAYTEVADNFNPEVGFRRRDNGYRKFEARVFTRLRPRDFFNFQELRPHATYEGFWNFEGFQESGRWHVDNHWEFKSGAEVHTGINLTREGVVESFEISDGVFVTPGTYDHAEFALVSFTNRGAPLSAGLRLTRGGFFGGDRLALSPDVRFRIGETFTTDVRVDYNDIDLPGGSFTTNLIRARVSYSFTPSVFVQGLGQYNTAADVWSVNLRFGWLQTANTGVFIVYNDTRGFTDAASDINDRSLAIKISRMFDVLN